MSSHQVNGDVPSATRSSAFIQHLLKYPIIGDSVETFQSNDLGQKSIQLGDSAYKTFAAPVVPFFSKPYQYVSPYVTKVDSLGDKALDRVDERFPVVKKPTNELINETRDLIFLPLTKGLEGKDHLLKVYSNEYKKNEQPGLVAHSKAAVVTLLIVGNETLAWLGSFVTAKKEQANHVVNEKINQ